MEWHNEKRKISDLVPSENNPRILTEKQFKDLEKSLKKFNLAEIPAINTDNRILAGHQRIKILSLLGRGEEEIDVRVPDHTLTNAECDEYMLRSNKNVAEWDYEMLANQFDIADLEEVGFERWELGISSGNSDENTDEKPPKKEQKLHKCPECGHEFSD